MHQKVKHYYLILILYSKIGIGLLKKKSKNYIQLDPKIYNLCSNHPKKIIELKEEDNKPINNNKKEMKLNLINSEIKKVDFLINIIDNIETKKNQEKYNISQNVEKLFLMKNHICPSNSINNKNVCSIKIKNKEGLKNEP